jgi:signal transduction histidine kinase
MKVADMEAATIESESPLSPAVLRTLFLFETLADDDLEALASQGQLVGYGVGRLISEGEPARDFYALVDGEIALSKRCADRDVETMRTDHRGAYCGATASFIDEPPTAYGFSVRTTKPTRLIRIDADHFGAFVRARYPMAVHLLQGMIVDHEGVHQLIDQQRRIQAAGTLTAGLMHGLNNPAGAMARIATQLRACLADDHEFRVHQRLSPAASQLYTTLRREVVDSVGNVLTSPLSASRRIHREEEFDDWLTARGVEEPWSYAPSLAAGGLSPVSLQLMADTLTGPDAARDLSAVVSAVAERIDTLLLLHDLGAASAEVSALVRSAQQYSQLDASPLTYCDLHELLDSTLTVMAAATGGSIAVHRDYAADLPAMLCHAGELNQAWTNIVDNAIDAIRATPTEAGVITVRTSLVDPATVRVDVEDNGVGIDAAIRDRIFLPFFTTKPVGQGVGMGLDLAWRTIVGLHGGTLGVESQPGATRFTACLPLDRSDDRGSARTQ